MFLICVRYRALAAVIVFVLIAQTSCCRKRCARKSFYFSRDEATWDGAQRQCAELGLQMASIMSDIEMKTFREAQLLGIELLSYWVAGHRTTSSHMFHWQWNLGRLSKLKSMNFTNWESGEPDNGDRHCAAVYSGGSWYNQDCDYQKYYVCENIV